MSWDSPMGQSVHLVVQQKYGSYERSGNSTGDEGYTCLGERVRLVHLEGGGIIRLRSACGIGRR